MTVIREFRIGDMGDVVAAQARYYAAANGWTTGLEALLLEVTAQFLRQHVPGRSNCWIAEADGVIAGSVFCFDAGGGVAQLRLMYVDATLRGQGVGGALLDRCIAFARAAGYREMTLWTHTVLAGARRIYARAGFAIVATAVHDEFGEPVQGETWQLALK